MQGNMWLLGLIYNLINNEQSFELDFSLHFYCDLTLEFQFFFFFFGHSFQRHSFSTFDMPALLLAVAMM